MISVRRAVPADAEAMSQVLIRSITELCRADHHDDPKAVATWIANKTPEVIRTWFANPALTLFLAERDGLPAAAGGIDKDGMVMLNYVSPQHRFMGVSKALLGAMEAELKARGVAEARLTSTATALQFYKANGWQEPGRPMSARACAAIR